MKKSFPTLLTILMASLVSAGPVEGVRQLLEGSGEILVLILEFIGDLILDINQVDEFLFAKIIFLVLIYLVIYVTIKKNDFFGNQETIIRIIAAAISILAVKFIPDELVQVIFLQYSTLGAAIGMFIPFILILFFLHQSNFGPLPRKIGWFVYGVSYIAIFSYTYTDLTGIAGYIYWTGIIGIIMAFFFDRQIHARFGDVALQQARSAHDAQRYAAIQQRINDLNTQISSGTLPANIQTRLERTVRNLHRQQERINRRL